MISKAKELGMKVMVGCMNESTVGSSAIAHLLPFIDHVDMDGPRLLEEDVATGLPAFFKNPLRTNTTVKILACSFHAVECGDELKQSSLLFLIKTTYAYFDKFF